MACTRSTHSIDFNPLLPCGRRRSALCPFFQMEDISIHSSRAGGDVSAAQAVEKVAISIHSSRAGGDTRERPSRPSRPISIHSSRAGGDDQASLCVLRMQQFQSTPPVREETAVANGLWEDEDISIHSSRAGGDTVYDLEFPCGIEFQSTPPVREETAVGSAVREALEDFNPLLPCGRRRDSLARRIQCSEFQSTPPVREETACAQSLSSASADFNPLLPCGRRRQNTPMFCIQKYSTLYKITGASACTNPGIHRYSRDHPGFFWCEASPMQ